MHWIIQENLYNEIGFDALISTLERFSIPYTLVKVIPFTDGMLLKDRIIPYVNPENPVMVCGSTTLAKIAKEQDWYPGSFLNENFDYRIWKKFYKNHLLNFDAISCKFSEVDNRWNEFFIRPCEDSKSFNGGIFEYNDFNEWRNKVVNLKETYTTLDGDTMVMYSPIKEIHKEYRFFVIDGIIVGKSQYKLGNKVVYNELVDDAAYDFAKYMVDIWQPARGFVIDIALLDDNIHKIVEINNLNSAGFYNIDIQSFVFAIENMKYEI